MFIKGKCAIYIDKNLRVYENSTVIFVLWVKQYASARMAVGIKRKENVVIPDNDLKRRYL